MTGGSTKVHQCEEKFPGVLVYASASSEYLFELSHGANFTVKHDQTASRHIHTG